MLWTGSAPPPHEKEPFRVQAFLMERMRLVSRVLRFRDERVHMDWVCAPSTVSGTVNNTCQASDLIYQACERAQRALMLRTG